MNLPNNTVEVLCGVLEQLVALVKEQAVIIEQNAALDAETKRELNNKREDLINKVDYYYGGKQKC